MCVCVCVCVGAYAGDGVVHSLVASCLRNLCAQRAHHSMAIKDDVVRILALLCSDSLVECRRYAGHTIPSTPHTRTCMNTHSLNAHTPWRAVVSAHALCITCHTQLHTHTVTDKHSHTHTHTPVRIHTRTSFSCTHVLGHGW